VLLDSAGGPARDCQGLNDSAIAVTVRQFGVFLRNRSGETLTTRHHGTRDPTEPRNGFQWSTRFAELADFGFGLHSGIQGWLQLAGGQIISL